MKKYVINIMSISIFYDQHEYIHSNFNILQYNKYEKRKLKLSTYDNILCICYFSYINNKQQFYLH